MNPSLPHLAAAACIAATALVAGCKRAEAPSPASTAPLPSSASSPMAGVVPTDAGASAAASDRPQAVPMGAVEPDKRVPGGAGADTTGTAPAPTGGDAAPGAPASSASR